MARGTFLCLVSTSYAVPPEARGLQRMHGDALSVADWIRLSRFKAVRASRRCTAKLVRLAALLSLSGGWLALRAAESSWLLSLPDGKEIEKVHGTAPSSVADSPLLRRGAGAAPVPVQRASVLIAISAAWSKRRTPRSPFALGSLGILQLFAKALAGREIEMRARPAVPGCVWTARAPISLHLLRAANPRASSLSFICLMGS